MKRRLLILTLFGALLIGVVSPSVAGTAQAAQHARLQHVQSHPAAFDKTRFVAHLAAAYFVFHHWVWNPYKAGKLHGFHLLTYAKAALALLFAYHEVKKAYDIAKTSNSKTLQLLLVPMNKLADAFNALSSKVKSHSFSSSDINGVNSQATSFQSQAGKAGFAFKDAQSAQGCC
ncbi:MAG TPA: hypothetical protein VF221_04945 [Chloroflexota bacterium]